MLPDSVEATRTQMQTIRSLEALLVSLGVNKRFELSDYTWLIVGPKNRWMISVAGERVVLWGEGMALQRTFNNLDHLDAWLGPSGLDAAVRNLVRG